ncbi:MAG: hypothetical protein K8R68_04360 [Bacteroidales bacterium]|nr:hypothetical protein [Bacteroidales bacterium]
MIRTILTADKNTLTLKIPDKYIGKLIEIIAFTIDETSEKIMTVGKTKKQKISNKFRGSISTEKAENLQEQLINERKEWNRDI